MRKKDLPALIAIVGFSVIISYVLVRQFISTPKNMQQEVEVVTAINATFTVPTDGKNFNSSSINPTKLIEIAPNDNGQPFATSQY